MKEFEKFLGAIVDLSVVTVIVLCIKKDFLSGILKKEILKIFIKENFHEGSKLHTFTLV